MMITGQRKLWNASLSFLSCAAVALACTTVVVDDKVCDGPVVSGRTYHFADELNHRVASVARNAKQLLMHKITPTKASTYGEYLDNKHAFMCMELEIGASDFTICNDGYNEKGLGMSLQAMNRFGFEDDWLTWPLYDPNSPQKEAVHFWDLGMWIIASFETIAQVKAAMLNTQVVLDPTMYTEINKFINGVAGPYKTPQHLYVTEASGKTLLIEFEGTPNGAIVKMYDGPIVDDVGALSNPPYGFSGPGTPSGLYPEFIANYSSYLAANNYPAIGQPIPGPPGLGPAVKIPGAYDGFSRFVRLAMTRRIAMSQCWKAKSFGRLQVLSPAYVAKKWERTSATLQTVISCLQTIVLPRGFEDGGNVNPGEKEKEWSPWWVMRDHTNRVYYWKVANNPQWYKVDLKSKAWERFAKSRKMVKKPLKPDEKKNWVKDATFFALNGKVESWNNY